MQGYQRKFSKNFALGDQNHAMEIMLYEAWMRTHISFMNLNSNISNHVHTLTYSSFMSNFKHKLVLNRTQIKINNCFDLTLNSLEFVQVCPPKSNPLWILSKSPNFWTCSAKFRQSQHSNSKIEPSKNHP